MNLQSEVFIYDWLNDRYNQDLRRLIQSILDIDTIKDLSADKLIAVIQERLKITVDFIYIINGLPLTFKSFFLTGLYKESLDYIQALFSSLDNIKTAHLTTSNGKAAEIENLFNLFYNELANLFIMAYFYSSKSENKPLNTG